jgi:hypothetical protein
MNLSSIANRLVFDLRVVPQRLLRELTGKEQGKTGKSRAS